MQAPQSRPVSIVRSNDDPRPASPASSLEHDAGHSLAAAHDSLARLSLDKKSVTGQNCANCSLPMTGQFVRALGAVYHLDCFRCQDCNKVVAAKFFPVDSPDGSQYPLCETDYFRRLSLLCAKCGMALRGSYITALDLKFHVEHFTCSVCPTVFGPQDSYYEHDGAVYCHFHYSTRFAVKCTGCKTAILKQFVEINRNNTDEHWHPECYMIHKFWNIRLVPSSRSSLAAPLVEQSESQNSLNHTPSIATVSTNSDYQAQESKETPQSLKDKQKHMEQQVYKIWTVLSTFEESSAACISEKLRHVSNGQYLEGVKMAEKFVLHVETLFCAIDELGHQFRQVGAKEISHVREARLLCKKIVNFFSLLSHTHETGARKMGITQELLSLVTGLAHYLKILIRIALTAALRLERDYGNATAMNHFLGRLDRLARNPSASSSAVTKSNSNGVNDHQKAWTYGYRSLTRAVGTLVGQGEASTDLCDGCKQTVEEDCIRFGTSPRWHINCLRCRNCHRPATKDKSAFPPNPSDPSAPVYYKAFRIEVIHPDEPPGAHPSGQPPPQPRIRIGRPFCPTCKPSTYGSLQEGFESVTRLEQYAFLLCVALNKLYALLKQRGVVPALSESSEDDDSKSLYEQYRDSNDIKRMKSVNLDRRMSQTAKTPVRSMVVEAPPSRTIRPADSTGAMTATLALPGQSDPYSESLPRSSLEDPHHRSSPPTRSVPEVPTSPRPNFPRSTTAVRVVEDPAQAFYQHPGTFRDIADRRPRPGTDEGGITLGDIPQVMEAEQAKEQHRSLPRQGHLLLSELTALEYIIVKHVAALTLASDNSPLREVAGLDELLDMIDARKNTFWGKLFKPGDKKVAKKKGVFGIPLDVLVDRSGVDSMHGAGPCSLRVPSFVDDCISALKQMDMSVEGIFRKNGNIRRLKELSDALDRDPDMVNLEDDNPVQLAALLKKFLRDLPDPLLTFKLQHLFLASQKIEPESERKRILHLVCCLMPKPHRDTMEVLFCFLKWVAQFSHVDEETGSKMDLQNLATVICPNILYAKGKDPSKDEHFLGIRAVHELLEDQDQFWLVPDDLAAVLQDEDLSSKGEELTSKDILRKAEYYVRKRSKSKSQQFAPDTAPHRGEVRPNHPHFSPGAFAQLPNFDAPKSASPPIGNANRPMSWGYNPQANLNYRQHPQGGMSVPPRPPPGMASPLSPRDSQTYQRH